MDPVNVYRIDGKLVNENVLFPIYKNESK
ncbi:protein of unknown function [Acetoanaerobium sticklandii]|uniref:Uncharacterized protein n=1 Tax=Acetoanaerobium sticklandii (strain ATCC 12662 / DSM 519 / JCM 1433 / CCUG 9281 / NCIMB 10654 / HF) TaxID=499177 RepID=E3PXE2_ACESD|nr:protein of unknown function [Acetoanaerobium sticklandii]